MLITSKDVTVQTSGMKDTTEFRANLDGMMFDNLINGIYSNKIGAGIREYATNARDGHARKGNLDTPFDVGLPNRDKAFFEVRDYGSSLTHEEVFNIFAVLGESTKRDTNDETGCLGLGSKSAFAYTNAFSVTCWKNETKRDYSCYLAEDGKPMVSLISEIKSREPEGVRISYAVKQQDIDDFNKEASSQLRGFNPQPNIIRSTSAYKPLNEDDLLLKGDGWKIYKPNTSQTTYHYSARGKPMAIQGAVAYPIDAENSSLKTAIYNRHDAQANTIMRVLKATDILIEFEIGQLRMTTSREELAYDEKTCNNIADKLHQVVQNVQKVLDQEYASCKTMKEAQILRSGNKDTSIREIENVIGVKDRMWNGELIKSTLTIAQWKDEIGVLKGNFLEKSTYYNSDPKNEFLRSVNGKLRIIQDYNYRNKFGEVKAQFQWPQLDNKNTEREISVKAHKVSDIKVLIEIESLITGNKNSLMRRFWRDTLVHRGDSKFIWIKVDSMQDAKTFLEHIYHDDRSNQVYLHKLNELKMPKKGTSKNSVVVNTTNPLERKFRYVIGDRYTYSNAPAAYEVLDLSTQTKKAPIVFFKEGKFFLTEKEYLDPNCVTWKSLEDVQRYIWTWSDQAKIYVINGQQKKFYQDNKQYFQEMVPYLKEQWMTKNTGWEKSYAETTYVGDDQRNRELGQQFKTLSQKYDINFKSIEAQLKLDWDTIDKYKSPNRYLSSMPENYEDVLKKELEKAVKDNPQPPQRQDYLKLARDPVIAYLVDQISSFSTHRKLVEAIRHYKKLIKE